MTGEKKSLFRKRKIARSGICFVSKLSLQPKIKEKYLYSKLPDSITVVRQTLTLFVLVRIQVRQQNPSFSFTGRGVYFKIPELFFRKEKNAIE